MIDINEIDPSNYVHYYLTEDYGDISLKFFTSTGYVDVNPDEYDCFSTEYGTLIAYKIHDSSCHSYIYFSNSEEKHVDTMIYEGVEDIYKEIPEGTMRMFSFMGSAEIPNRNDYKKETGDPNDVNRCDYTKYGPSAFYPIANPINVIGIKCLMNFNGIGHVVCIEARHVDNPNPTSQSVNTGGKTLTGVLKTVHEWAIVNSPPFSNQEPISQKSKEFLEKVQIPEDVMSDVLNSQVDMRVARYLQGETRNPYAIEENNTIPDSLKELFKTRCRYNNLFTMKSIHPNGSFISNSIIEKEKNAIGKKIVNFCIDNVINYENDGELEAFLRIYSHPEIEKLISLYERMV